MKYSIQFYKHSAYLHLYHVKGLHQDLLERFPIDFHEEGKETIKNIDAVANYPIDPHKGKFVSDIIDFIIEEYYVIDKKFDNIACGGYYQTDKEYTSQFHNHIMNSTITGTAYINPTKPGEGGELEMIFPNYQKIKYQPQEDIISLFPSWMLHRPLPQTRKEPRICLNYCFNSVKRPIHKMTGDKW